MRLCGGELSFPSHEMRSLHACPFPVLLRPGGQDFHPPSDALAADPSSRSDGAPVGPVPDPRRSGSGRSDLVEVERNPSAGPAFGSALLRRRPRRGVEGTLEDRTLAVGVGFRDVRQAAGFARARPADDPDHRLGAGTALLCHLPLWRPARGGPLRLVRFGEHRAIGSGLSGRNHAHPPRRSDGTAYPAAVGRDGGGHPKGLPGHIDLGVARQHSGSEPAVQHGGLAEHRPFPDAGRSRWPTSSSCTGTRSKPWTSSTCNGSLPTTR
jgi:hypothetical protein